MQFHQRLFTGILLLLIGILLGALVMIYRGGLEPDDRAEVQVTEVKRSSGGSADTAAGSEIARAQGLFQNTAKEVTPSVVYIESSVSMRDRGMPDDDYHDFDDDGGFWDNFMDRRAQTIGSGVILSEEGYILTNNHVVGDSGDGIRVNLDDKRYFDARVVGRNPSTDLAVLKIDADNLQPATLGDSDEVTVGDWVMAVGNPFQLQSTVTAGIVSALGRDVDIIREQMPIENFIQTDAAINQGNSGGALVNAHGELIGINTAIATESGTYQGYGFAVPINMAFKIASDIIEYGEFRRGMMGVEIAPVTQDRAEALEMDRIRGVEIMGVASGGGADMAGIRENDVIIEVDGREVNEPNQLQARVAILDPDDDVEIKVVRDGEEISKTLTLSDSQDQEIASWQEDQTPAEPEMFLEPRDDDIEVREFEVGLEVAKVAYDDEESELVILRVIPDSPADYANLQSEQTILEVDGDQVSTLNELEEALVLGMTTEDSFSITVKTVDGDQEEIEISN